VSFRRALGLILATHPGPTVAVVGYATATAVASGVSNSKCALLAFAVLCGQASVGWSNDFLDAPLDVVRRREEKPIAQGLVSQRAVGLGAVIALVVCVPASLLLGWRAGGAHLIAVAAAWSYNLGLKRVPLSPLPYVLAFGLVPVVVAWTLPGHPEPPGRLVVASALLGLSAHLTNAVKDLTDDAATGVRGLPQRLGPRTSTLLSTIAVIAAVVVFLSMPGRREALTYVLGAVSLVISAATVVLAFTDRTRQLFELSILAVLPLVIAVAATGGVKP
jgi:4-hydroxybenzoate polyprenyltransferase